MTTLPPGPSPRPVLIVGAGIAGLTLALLLSRRGVACTVLERRTRLEAVGAGIQLSPNASRILIAAGLGAALARKAVAPARLVVRDGRSAAELSHAPLGDGVRERYGAPWWVIHRADLQSVLLDAVRSAQDVRLLFGRSFVASVQDGAGVRVTVETDRGGTEQHQGAVLIGADGLWSGVADQIDRPAEPRFRGYTAWRATIPTEMVPAPFHRMETGLWLGADAHLVHYPVRAGTDINVVAILGDTSLADTTARRGWTHARPTAGPSDQFRKWAPAARDLLGLIRDWQSWSLYDRPTRATWMRGRMVLMGDAAHPMVPFLAQGGAMAVEDAAVLTEKLAPALADGSGSDAAVTGALAAYVRARRPRTIRVQTEARRNGTIYHLDGPLALARNLALRRWAGPGMLQRLDWLYGWSPAQDN